MTRVIYFGTQEHLVHAPRVILGKELTPAERKAIRRLEYKVPYHFRYTRFNVTICNIDYIGFSVPFSADDSEKGCVTFVLVDSKDWGDIAKAIKNDEFLRQQFSKIFAAHQYPTHFLEWALPII